MWSRIFPTQGSALLHRFLQIALDKWDERYDYPTYMGLALLPMPSVDDPPEQLPLRTVAE